MIKINHGSLHDLNYIFANINCLIQLIAPLWQATSSWCGVGDGFESCQQKACQNFTVSCSIMPRTRCFFYAASFLVECFLDTVLHPSVGVSPVLCYLHQQNVASILCRLHQEVFLIISSAISISKCVVISLIAWSVLSQKETWTSLDHRINHGSIVSLHHSEANFVSNSLVLALSINWLVSFLFIVIWVGIPTDLDWSFFLGA